MTAVLGAGVDPKAWQRTTIEAISGSGLDPAEVATVIARALAEDLKDGPDATTAATVPAGRVAAADITPRQAGVLAGGAVALAVFDSLIGDRLTVRCVQADGSALVPGEPAISLSGPVSEILSAERTALNLVTHLSGVATATRQWVDAVAGTGARIRDTRKTIPGLRALQKYAVRCGGGVNHRFSLGDAVLIKDNHVAAAGSVTAAVAAVRALRPDLPMEVEVDTLDQLAEALQAGAQVVLLDNFDLPSTAEAVRQVRRTRPGVLIEASGGLSVDRARAVAETGVDYLAVGALTHSSPIVDLGLDLLR